MINALNNLEQKVEITQTGVQVELAKVNKKLDNTTKSNLDGPG
jgi:hypothetical protein